MKRITEKEDIYIKSDGECEYKLTSSNDGISILKCDPIEIMNLDKATEKLHKILEIEDELGIDLITLFKALKGIWIKDNDRTYYVGSPYLCYAENKKRELEFQFKVVDTWFYIKDYGKTWVLDKQTLEK